MVHRRCRTASPAGWPSRNQPATADSAGLERRRTEGKPVGRQPGAADKKPRRRSGYVVRWERERRARIPARAGRPAP